MAVIVTKPSQQVVDQFKYCSTWECNPAVLPTEFREDEYFLWISGEADLDVEGAERITLHPGDLVLCQKGTRLTWYITTRVKKYYKPLVNMF